MNTENYKEAFLEEAVENINNMNKALLNFEKNIEDLTPINELFRAAHTLKGMSATMGYDKLAEFTHMLEDVMDSIRSGTVAPDLEIVNLLFKSIDVMQDFIDNIRTQNVDFAKGYKEIIAGIKSKNGAPAGEIRTKTETRPAEKTASAPSAAAGAIGITVEDMILDEAEKQSMKVFKIRVTISKSCAFKSVRAFMVSRNLSEKGEIVKSLPKAKDIEEGNFDNTFELAYVTKLEKAEVENAVTRIAEIEKAEVEEVAIKKEEDGVKQTDDGRSDENKNESDGKKKASAISQSVRVNIEKLDSMMNLVGELVIAKIRLDQITRNRAYKELASSVDDFDRIINELQIEVTDVRMLPVSHIFDRYPRIVRDLCAQSGKLAEVEITGGDIEIDRTVLEEINEPILHLVRNCIAHGLETPQQRELAGKVKKGIIRLSARRDRNSVIIEVSDDGRGISIDRVRKKALEKKLIAADKIDSVSDDELINMIALPGFSTAEKVDQVSGRGVGVDVVKTKVEAFGGIFRMENYPGEGMKSILKLPLTLAIIQALLVRSADATYAIPVIHTIETVELPSKDIKGIQSKRVIIMRGEVVPVLSLAELIGKARAELKETANMVIIEARDRKIALEVDAVLGQQEIAIKSLGEFLKYAKGFSGVTILGDGSISLIVDIQSLIESNLKLV
jgi:two-component system, chemotaxis family, sensor kinase CheA